MRITEGLAERAYLSIREAILRGTLRIGSPLSPRRLAAQLNMSLVPVREALQRLEIDGLVETRERAGTRVRTPTRGDIEEHHILREALESQAARLVAQRASLQQFQELRRIAEQVDILFDRCSRVEVEDDPELLYTANSRHVELHIRIAEFAACNTLRDAIEKSHVLTLNWLYLVTDPQQRQLPRYFHRDLIDILSRRDIEQADHVMRAHVQQGLERLLKNIRLIENSKWRDLDPRSELEQALSSQPTSGEVN